LSNNNINPNIDDINKLIRGHDNSLATKYQDLIFAVSRYKNLSNQEPKIKEKPKDNNAMINDCDRKRTMMIVGNTPMYLPKRKTIAGDPNYTSNKEHFDYTSIKKLNEEPKFTRSPYKLRQSDQNEGKISAYGDNGNILLFGDCEPDSIKTNLKRKDPNHKKKDSFTPSISKKSLKMFKESSENTLKYNS